MAKERRRRMPDHELAEPVAPRRGVAIKLLGVVLIILGVLDSMLSWRGGFALNEAYVLLIASGIFVYAVGAIVHGSRSQSGSTATSRRGPIQ